MIRKYIRKIARVSTHSFTINIPKEVMRDFGWRERQRLELTADLESNELSIVSWKRPSKDDEMEILEDKN